MRKWLQCDERYPDYMVYDHGENGGAEVEISVEDFQRGMKAEAEYKWWQDLLKSLDT